jgi:putative ABC transport system permease protein
MFRTTLKSILSHKLRLLLTALSIVFGVGFVAGTYMLTDTMNAAFDGLFQQINQGTAVEVSGIPQFSGGPPGSSGPGTTERVPTTLVEPIRAVDGVQAAYGTIGGYAQLVDSHGKAIQPGTAPTLGTSWRPTRAEFADDPSGGRPRAARPPTRHGREVRLQARADRQGPSRGRCSQIVGIVAPGRRTTRWGRQGV